MSTNETRPNKGTVADCSITTLPAYEWLGRDQDDHTHILDRKRDVVHRIDPLAAERVAVYDLYADGRLDCRGNAVETYVDFVADKLGWAERTFLNRDIFGGR